MKFLCHSILFIICLSAVSMNPCASIIDSKFINVPLPQFKNTLDSTMELVQNLASSMSNFLKQSDEDGDQGRNLMLATSHCADMLVSTSEALNWSLSTIHQGPKGYKEYDGKGDVISHARTRMRTNLGSLKTCSEAFDGTTKYSLVAESFKKVTNSTNELLSMLQVQQNSEAQAGWNFLQMPNVTVGKDGSGNYTTVMEAIAAAPNHSQSYYVIFVKQGVYHEYVTIDGEKINLVLIGEGMNATTISGRRSNVTGWPTYDTATFGVRGEGFIAMDIGFNNAAGPQGLQAVALQSSGDRSSFYRCKISGYQDTLLVQSGRSFFRECEISGSIDFIFGYGTAVFQNCVILVRTQPGSRISVVTAHGRFALNDPSGFSFQSCKIYPASYPRSNGTLMYLGRPWGQYSRTIFMESYINNYIVPQGWLQWNHQSNFDTLYYGEYMNTGPGSDVSGRVKWPGYHIITDQSVADGFTAAKFIDGDSWLPSTGIPYTQGLTD